MQERIKLKTYSHLLPLQRRVNDYDLTSKLLYYPQLGPEIETPVTNWYSKNSDLFQNVIWENFIDPGHLTYSNYVALRAKKELFIDELLKSERIEAQSKEILNTLRFPCHGLQMMIAYVGQMIPASRATICCMLQAADEMRRIQTFAYLSLSKSDHFDGRKAWESDPDWQPFRKFIEKLLITYDWQEAFIVLQFMLKPSFDNVFIRELGAFSEKNNNFILNRILQSIWEDCEWHKLWSQSLLDLIISSDERNAAIVSEIKRKWANELDEAISPWKQKFL